MLKMSFLNLARHKLRTLLSVLGIVLGVASLIVLVSLVDGIRFDVEEAIAQAQGARVTPLNSSSPIFDSFDESWAEKIEKIQGVRVALPVIIQLARTIEGEEISFFGGIRIIGVTLTKLSRAAGSGIDGEILEGRDFKSSDSGKFVALIGKPIKEDFQKFVGSKIKVNDESLRIIGVFTTGSDLVDGSILMPIDTARKVTGFPNNQVSFITVQLVNPSKDQEIVKRINLIYGDEIKATSLSDFSAQFGAIFDSITTLVVVIASIASLVAAVGIINTMLMSVLERFREIGALKAVGWSNGNIMKMILYESVFVGVIGGLFGLIVGILVSGFIEQFGFTTVVTPFLLFGSFFGAVVVGVIGGIYPAYIASKMDPIEALRTE